VLVGWLLNLRILTTLFLAHTPVAFSTSVALIGASLSLMLRYRFGNEDGPKLRPSHFRRQEIALRSPAIIVVMIAALVLAHYICASWFDLDQWLYRRIDAISWTADLARMAPNTAFAVLLLYR
jgi:hypothetical protein